MANYTVISAILMVYILYYYSFLINECLIIIEIIISDLWYNNIILAIDIIHSAWNISVFHLHENQEWANKNWH